MREDAHRPGVAAGAVGSFIADGAGGGRTVTMPGMTTKVGAGGTAIAEGTKPVRGFLRSGVVQDAMR